MQFYKICLNWLKYQDSQQEYQRLENQLHSFSQNFKNEIFQEMFYVHKKSKVISMFRLTIVFQILLNIFYALTLYISFNQQVASIFRGLFIIWLICTLIIMQISSSSWINKINFFLVLNSFINIAIFAHFYLIVLKAQEDFETIIQISLIAGLTQGLFAISYVLACPSWRCQSLIVFGYFSILMLISGEFKNFRVLYSTQFPSLLVFFVCFVLRMNDKYTKLMFLQVHYQKSNIQACKDIFDQCVPSSIIIIKTQQVKTPLIYNSEQESLNTSKPNNLQLLYANKFALQYLQCSTESDCANQIETISIIQDENDSTKNLTDFLTLYPSSQLIKNYTDYALGSDQQILSGCRSISDSTLTEGLSQKTQYCDVKLKSCIWEGQQSIIIVLNDTTDRITRIDQLKELNQYKDNLLATVSHDLKTPLNATQLLLFAMKQICKTKKALDIADIENLLRSIKDIYLSNCMLITMINDLLDYSQIRQGVLRLQVEKFNLDECLDSVYSLFHRQTLCKKLKLIFEKENFSGPLPLESDQNRLKQILINLVSNSLKFTFVGEITLKIIHQEPYIKFTVQDTGIGMPQSVVEKLFKQYASFNLGNKNSQGVGLGLVISSKLVGLLGTSEVISVDSEQGVGTRFSFRIFRSLIKKSAIFPIDEVMDVVQKPYLTQKSLKLLSISKSVSVPKFQVMIVDDTVFNIEAFRAILFKIVKCSVIDFYNGLDAVNYVKQGGQYDLIFMDINMPVMDGYTATKLIRKYENEQGNQPSIIIIASAFTIESQEYHQLQESEADGLIEKPVQIKKLVELLKKYKFVD